MMCELKIETPNDRQRGNWGQIEGPWETQRDPGEQRPKAWKSACDVINCRGISVIRLTDKMGIFER